MLLNNRIVYKDNTVLTDISALCANPHIGKKSFTLVAAEDALYVGSDFPFNHRFFLLGEKNTVAGSVSVAIWDGTNFTAVEDVQDLTALEGVPFARSGIIQFALPDDLSWYKVTDSSEVTDLSSLKAKGSYWAKFTFSAAFVFDLEYVGFRFAQDSDLNTYYKDLLDSRVMAAFNNGIPMDNWDKVHVIAAEEVVRDLKQDELIYSPNQLLDHEALTEPATHKLAEIAYSSLRNEVKLDFAERKYKKSLARKVFNVDRDLDGRLETTEKIQTGGLFRV